MRETRRFVTPKWREIKSKQWERSGGAASPEIRCKIFVDILKAGVLLNKAGLQNKSMSQKIYGTAGCGKGVNVFLRAKQLR
jgi:hypothetical protein